ncbi:GNAT family N-acetyltransferase [Cohaesibacter sp. ES.047]|uniref:GNAT family N-acetyltransferase n=1 Tax=Cohaesibacter sp. ES.047 TaxID=1798205 RepID=UPI0012FE1ED4|nr:GNAT family N-acetyltransferase [Cohaesibacter sp. ES.047]
MHEAFVRASEGRLRPGPLHAISEQGYDFAWDVKRLLPSLGAKIATFLAHGTAPLGAGFSSHTLAAGDWTRTEAAFCNALDRMADASGADVIVWPYFPLEAQERGWLSSWLSDRLDRDISRLLLSSHEHQRAFLDAQINPDEPDGEYAGLSLSRNKRKTTGRQLRRLSELGQVHFRSTRGDLDLTEAMDVFLRTEASGWKAKSGTALAVDHGSRTFVESFMPAMIRDGLGQIDLMMLDDKCIAGLISLRAGRGLFTWKTGMDEVYKRFSPGVHVLMHVSQEALRDDTIDYVDSLADAGHPVAEHIWSGRRSFGRLYVPLNSHGIAAAQSLRASILLKDKARYWAKKVLGRG